MVLTGRPLDIQGGARKIRRREIIYFTSKRCENIFFTFTRHQNILLTFSVTADIHGVWEQIFFSPLLRRNLFISPFLRRNLFISKFLLATHPGISNGRLLFIDKVKISEFLFIFTHFLVSPLLIQSKHICNVIMSATYTLCPHTSPSSKMFSQDAKPQLCACLVVLRLEH